MIKLRPTRERGVEESNRTSEHKCVVKLTAAVAAFLAVSDHVLVAAAVALPITTASVLIRAFLEEKEEKKFPLAVV